MLAAVLWQTKPWRGTQSSPRVTEETNKVDRHVGVFQRWGIPKMDDLQWKSMKIPLKWMIWGYPYFGKHPCFRALFAKQDSVPYLIVWAYVHMDIVSLCIICIPLCCIHQGTHSHSQHRKGLADGTSTFMCCHWLTRSLHYIHGCRTPRVAASQSKLLSTWSWIVVVLLVLLVHLDYLNWGCDLKDSDKPPWKIVTPYWSTLILLID